MVTKEDFARIIKSLETQFRHDEKRSRDLSKVLGFGEGEMYNNQELVDCIVSFLASNFKNQEQARDAINDFMYDFNFGKDAKYVNSSDKLWERLLEVCVLKTNDRKKLTGKKVSVVELEMMLNNITNLTAMYKKEFLKDGSDSELQNITNALEINIDFLKKLTKRDYEKDLKSILVNFETIKRSDNE